MVKQLSVFLENSKGRLAHMTKLLGEAGIDLLALSIADTTDYGILRAIVNDNELAQRTLKQAGYTVNITDVLAVAVPDEPGGLAAALGALSDADISVEYLYSFVRKPKKNALILFKVDDLARAGQVMAALGLQPLQQDELVAL